MKRLLIIMTVLMLAVLNVSAQSAKSDSLFAYGIELYNAGKYKEAIPIFRNCISLDNEEPYRIRLSPPNKRWEYSIMWLASCYYQLGDSTMADSFFYNYIDSIIDKYYLFPVDRRITTKSDSLLYVGELLYDNANYEAALNNFREGMNLEKNILGESHPWYKKTISRYADMLFHIAGYNSRIGNPSKAVSLCKEGLMIKKNVCGKEHRDFAIGKTNLAIYYAELGNYDDAINESIEAISLIERIWGKEDPIYATAINNLAGYYYERGYLIEAIQESLKAFKIRLQSGNIDDQLNSLGWLAFYHSSVDDYDSAIQICSLALQILNRTEHDREIINELTEDPIRKDTIYEGFAVFNSSNYQLFLEMMAYCNYRVGNLSALEEYSLSSYEIGKYIINSTFRDLTDDERNLFWKKYDTKFLVFPHLYSYKYPTESLIKCSYNASLLSKGLLLNLSRSMSELIQGSGDQEALSLYNNLRLNRMTLQKQYEKPKAERTLDTDSLEALTADMERKLIKKSKAFGDYTKDMSIQWEDVQKKLTTKDVCIEFVSFPLNKDSIMYVAYVLTKCMLTPKMIPLFEEKQLQKEEGLYENNSISKLVWEPLSEYLIGKKNVYFSPSGELYNISIEYLPHWSEDSLMTDKWNMYRLSSTRELAVMKRQNSRKRAVLYGGIDYDAGTRVLVADSKKYPQKRTFDNMHHYAITDSLNLRDYVNELPETKVEVELIEKSMKNKKIDTSLRMDTLATEGDFKNLSGKSTRLIHVATHGFYWTDSEARKKDISFIKELIRNENMPSRYIEDKVLTRSGLLLTGANNALRGKELPDSINDGILTAKEISQLDLRGLDLAVLSACQTGLGEIKGDGVFGLQRGFKKAGANTILMSLWKVDDKATQLLMTRFYENLLSGKSKYESLIEAQRYLRNYEEEKKKGVGTALTYLSMKPGKKEQAIKQEVVKKKVYNKPDYWAAFILLDGLD